MNRKNLQIAIIGSVMLVVAICLVSLIYPIASRTSIFKDLSFNFSAKSYFLADLPSDSPVATCPDPVTGEQYCLTQNNNAYNLKQCLQGAGGHCVECADSTDCTHGDTPCNLSTHLCASLTGACGTANGHTYAYNAGGFGSFTFCSTYSDSSNFTAPGFPSPGGSANWTCPGVNGGANSPTCTATVSSTPIDGSCGSAAQTYASNANAFSGSLCSPGETASPSSPAFPSPGNSVTWTCGGLYGGNPSPTCTATVSSTPIDGSCGTANGHTYAYNAGGFGLFTVCATGSNPNPTFPPPGGSVNWICGGVNGGNPSLTCTATVATMGTPISGCMDSSAINYNPSATQSDGGCQFGGGGCDSPLPDHCCDLSITTPCYISSSSFFVSENNSTCCNKYTTVCALQLGYTQAVLPQKPQLELKDICCPIAQSCGSLCCATGLTCGPNNTCVPKTSCPSICPQNKTQNSDCTCSCSLSNPSNSTQNPNDCSFTCNPGSTLSSDGKTCIPSVYTPLTILTPVYPSCPSACSSPNQIQASYPGCGCSCSNTTCPTGQTLNQSDCSCSTNNCLTSCSQDEIQAAYPDCTCSKCPTLKIVYPSNPNPVTPSPVGFGCEPQAGPILANNKKSGLGGSAIYTFDVFGKINPSDVVTWSIGLNSLSPSVATGDTYVGIGAPKSGSQIGGFDVTETDPNTGKVVAEATCPTIDPPDACDVGNTQCGDTCCGLGSTCNDQMQCSAPEVSSTPTPKLSVVCNSDQTIFAEVGTPSFSASVLNNQENTFMDSSGYVYEWSLGNKVVAGDAATNGQTITFPPSKTKVKISITLTVTAYEKNEDGSKGSSIGSGQCNIVVLPAKQKPNLICKFVKVDSAGNLIFSASFDNLQDPFNQGNFTGFQWYAGGPILTPAKESSKIQDNTFSVLPQDCGNGVNVYAAFAGTDSGADLPPVFFSASCPVPNPKLTCKLNGVKDGNAQYTVILDPPLEDYFDQYSFSGGTWKSSNSNGQIGTLDQGHPGSNLYLYPWSFNIPTGSASGVTVTANFKNRDSSVKVNGDQPDSLTAACPGVNDCNASIACAGDPNPVDMTDKEGYPDVTFTAQVGPGDLKFYTASAKFVGAGIKLTSADENNIETDTEKQSVTFVATPTAPGLLYGRVTLTPNSNCPVGTKSVSATCYVGVNPYTNCSALDSQSKNADQVLAGSNVSFKANDLDVPQANVQYAWTMPPAFTNIKPNLQSSNVSATTGGQKAGQQQVTVTASVDTPKGVLKSSSVCKFNMFKVGCVIKNDAGKELTEAYVGDKVTVEPTVDGYDRTPDLSQSKWSVTDPSGKTNPPVGKDMTYQAGKEGIATFSVTVQTGNTASFGETENVQEIGTGSCNLNILSSKKKPLYVTCTPAGKAGNMYKFSVDAVDNDSLFDTATYTPPSGTSYTQGVGDAWKQTQNNDGTVSGNGNITLKVDPDTGKTGFSFSVTVTKTYDQDTPSEYTRTGSVECKSSGIPEGSLAVSCSVSKSGSGKVAPDPVNPPNSNTDKTGDGVFETTNTYSKHPLLACQKYDFSSIVSGATPPPNLNQEWSKGPTGVTFDKSGTEEVTDTVTNTNNNLKTPETGIGKCAVTISDNFDAGCPEATVNATIGQSFTIPLNPGGGTYDAGCKNTSYFACGANKTNTKPPNWAINENYNTFPIENGNITIPSGVSPVKNTTFFVCHSPTDKKDTCKTVAQTQCKTCTVKINWRKSK